MRATLGFVCVWCALAAGGPARAAEAEPTAPSGAVSTGTEGDVGARARWDALPPERRAELQARWRRFQELEPREQEALKQRFARYRALTPDQREQIRSRWQRFQDLSPKEKRALRKAFRRFQDLPPAQRERIRALFDRIMALPPEKRQQLFQKLKDRKRKGTLRRGR